MNYLSWVFNRIFFGTYLRSFFKNSREVFVQSCTRLIVSLFKGLVNPFAVAGFYRLSIFDQPCTRLFINFMIYRFENLCYTHEESRNTDTTMEKQFINQISSALGFFTETQSGYKFQCPYCQRGNKDHKGRAMSLGRVKGSLYRVNGRNDWKYRCFRCGEHKAFHHFLEDHFPKHFEAYIRQRDAVGTTGKHTNCPKLETVLKGRGMLPEGTPEFHKHRPLPAPQTPQHEASKSLQQAPQVTVTLAPPSVTKLPPIKSPQQQAGCQARINHEIKQREKRRRERSGELW